MPVNHYSYVRYELTSQSQSIVDVVGQTSRCRVHAGVNSSGLEERLQSSLARCVQHLDAINQHTIHM